MFLQNKCRFCTYSFPILKVSQVRHCDKLHFSAIILKLLTGEVDLVTMPNVNGWDPLKSVSSIIRKQVNSHFSKLMCWKQVKMGVMIWVTLPRAKLCWLADWVRTSQYCGVFQVCRVSTYQRWSKERQLVNQWQGHWHPWHTDAHGEQRLGHLLQSQRRGTVAQIAAVRVSMLTPVHCRKQLQWPWEHVNLTTKQWKKVACSDELLFLLVRQVHVHQLLGKVMAPGWTIGRRQVGTSRALL